jgi:hypothetical protein
MRKDPESTDPHQALPEVELPELPPYPTIGLEHVVKREAEDLE